MAIRGGCLGLLLAAVAVYSGPTALAQPSGPAILFTDVTLQAGFTYEHGYVNASGFPMRIAGGVAAGDYDRDGWADLYVVRGDIGPNLLFRNRGDGTFEEVGTAAGLALEGHVGSGPTFGDLDADGWLDLVVGGIGGGGVLVFRNRGDGTFENVTAATGIVYGRDTFSAAFGDYDRDGLVDLALAHWIGPCGDEPCTGHLWRNLGDGTFRDDDVAAGITGYETLDHSFAPNFADINDDGWPDFLMASDFGTSRVYLNRGDGTFDNVTDPAVITDENGMGAAVADYDGDGDLDWFVTSIYDPFDGVPTGNRLYRNAGGVFEDATVGSGVRVGHWGWATCFADFDNDTDLDLFQTNGWPTPRYDGLPSLLFVSHGNGTFTEQGASAGVHDTGQGRGVVCFDADRDGDLDVFVANNSGPPVFYRNDTLGAGSALTVSLRARTRNVLGVGARVLLTAGGLTQVRELQIGSNFVSQQPAELYFGLGEVDLVDRLEVRWPDGIVNTLTGIAAGQVLEVRQVYDSVGVHLPAQATFELRHTNDAGAADMVLVFGPADPSALPLAGDWEGDGLGSVGAYTASNATFQLRAGDGSALTFRFGPPGGSRLPLAGDWDSDGVDTIGIFEPGGSRFSLRNSNSAGPADLSFGFGLSGAGWVPVAGDWDGDGRATVGLYRNGRFALRNENAPGTADFDFRLTGAPAGALPVVGDWNGDGTDSVGVYDAATGRFLLKIQLADGPADLIFAFGPAPGGAPLAGVWN